MFCKMCGKEIPDGEELCEDCKNKESQMDEAYLEELMQNMSDEEKEPENAGEPAPVMDEQVEEKPAEEASDGYEPCACDAHFLRSAASLEGNAGYAHQVSRRQTGRDGKRAHEEIRDLPAGDAEGAPRRAG